MGENRSYGRKEWTLGRYGVREKRWGPLIRLEISGQQIIIFQVLMEAGHIVSEFTPFAQHHKPSEQR